MDLQNTRLKIAIQNITKLSPTEFTLARKAAFGGSDTGVLTGVNPYQTLTELLTQKNNKTITDEELAIGKLPAVRKGRDVEPIILQKAASVLKSEVEKPDDMYEFVEFPYLRINYDGVTSDKIPVEAKVITKQGERHYDFAKAIYKEDALDGRCYRESLEIPDNFDELTILQKATYFGIPPYYYTQLQLEIAGLNAPYGYLAAIRDAFWELIIFRIPYDKHVFSEIVIKALNASQSLVK